MTQREAERLFKSLRTKFARTFPRILKATFRIANRRCVSDTHCRDRDLAYAIHEDMSITFLKRALDLPKDNVAGLMLHELGHLCDINIENSGREQRADDLAEIATGTAVRYDESDIQTVSKRGKYPRPLNLHC